MYHSGMDDSLPKKKAFDLRLTAAELVHLRDLFGVRLPPEMKTTLSQALAGAVERPWVEARLWQKVAAACRLAGVPLDEGAPDYVVAVSGTPAINVYELATEAGLDPGNGGGE